MGRGRGERLMSLVFGQGLGSHRYHNAVSPPKLHIPWSNSLRFWFFKPLVDLKSQAYPNKITENKKFSDRPKKHSQREKAEHVYCLEGSGCLIPCQLFSHWPFQAMDLVSSSPLPPFFMWAVMFKTGWKGGIRGKRNFLFHVPTILWEHLARVNSNYQLFLPSKGAMKKTWCVYFSVNWIFKSLPGNELMNIQSTFCKFMTKIKQK